MTVWKVKLSLYCVNTVILEVINQYNISKSQTGNLDTYKDITIVIFSFLIDAYLPRLGYKTFMLLGLALISITCYLTPIINQM